MLTQWSPGLDKEKDIIVAAMLTQGKGEGERGSIPAARLPRIMCFTVELSAMCVRHSERNSFTAFSLVTFSDLRVRERSTSKSLTITLGPGTHFLTAGPSSSFAPLIAPGVEGVRSSGFLSLPDPPAGKHTHNSTSKYSHLPWWPVLKNGTRRALISRGRSGLVCCD